MDIARAFELVLADMISLFPKVAISIMLFVLFMALVKVMNSAIRWLLKVAEIEELLKRYQASSLYPLIKRAFIVLVDLGLLFLLSAILLNIFIPSSNPNYHLYASYLSKVMSVTFLITVFIFGISSVTTLVKMENKAKGLVLMVSLLLVLAVIIDLTTLSDEVKAGLVSGISLGVGITIGVFSVWFFFKDSIEALCKRYQAGGGNAPSSGG